MVASFPIPMRPALPIVVACLFGCASRSQLDRTAPTNDATSADVTVSDTDQPDVLTFETWGREVAVSECSARTETCLIGHDFGPSKAVTDVYSACATKLGAACGDLSMVFDAEGCLVEIREIHDYTTAFVDCVAETTSATRWQCAKSRTLRMFQACP